MDSSEIIMPCGKHKGQRLGEIPTSYLEFVLQQYGAWSPGLAQDVRDELNRREQARKGHANLEKVLAKWRAKLRKRYSRHPTALALIGESESLLRKLLDDKQEGETERCLRQSNGWTN